MRLRTPSPTRSHSLSARRAACAALVALALPALLHPVAAGAEENTSARKFGRGLAGMSLGVLEIPGNVVQESRTNGVPYGMTVGLAMGLGKFVARELVGAYEFVTAPFEVPDHFETVPGRAYGFSDQYLSEEAYQLDRIPDAVVERRAGALVVRFPNDLLFALGSAELSPKATARLAKVAPVLRSNPDAPVVVAGYTDATGTPDYNQQLSRKRAAAVRDYLVSQGIAAERIEIAGYGDARPVASNDTLAGRRSNRRVEIELRASGVGAYR
jgi:putative exosortase-associated protein (TIGR04073 family)